MPWALILVVAGVVLLLVTSYATLGWVLICIGVGLFVLATLVYVGILTFISRRM